MDPARFCWGPAFAGVLPAVALIGIITFGYALLEIGSFLWYCTLHASWLGLLLGFCVLFGWDHFGGFVLCVAWVSFVVLYVSWLFFVPRLCAQPFFAHLVCVCVAAVVAAGARAVEQLPFAR